MCAHQVRPLLSPESTAVIEVTAAVVGEHAVEITTRFYSTMFDAHPELLRLFNKGSQASGEQQRALATAVVAYAVHLTDPGAPSFQPVLDRIAHKHLSLGVRPDQYSIVGRYLLAAVADVLGDAVTPAVARAWDEVYWLFASQLIAQEARLYRDYGVDPEHPWHRYRVVERIEEAVDVISLVLGPADGLPVPPHRPGQYVSVAVDLPDGSRQPRQYTVSTAPRDATLQITVRRVRGIDGHPDGEVSTFLHTGVQVGDELDVTTPCGDVVVEDGNGPLLLISAGVGITPVAAMLDDIAMRTPQRQVLLAHADRSAAHHALHGATTTAGATMPGFTSLNWYEHVAASDPDRTTQAGLMDLRDVTIPEHAHVFMCGPLPFMRGVRRTLIARGVRPGDIDYEVFGPDLWSAPAAVA